jgi:hypothetical protein
LSRLDEIRARLDGLRIAHLRWKELEVKITSGMARDFPLESLVHTPSPAEVLEAREAFLLKSAGAPAAVREGPKAVQRGAPGRRGGARKGAHRPGSGPAPRPEDFGCCEVGSEAGRGGGNRSEACGAEGTREEAYGRLAGAGGAVGMGEETGRTDADGLFRLNDGLAVLCSGCSWRTQGGSGPPEGGNGAISLLCYLDGQDVSLPGRAVESACELAEIVGRAKAARALASHWAGESPGFAMALLALERSGPPPSERDWPGARARLCAETGITVQQAEWLKRGKVLYADRTGAVVFTRLERGSAVPPVGADPRDGWEAPEAGRAGGGEAQEAGYASGGEAQEAGRAGGGEAQEAGRAGDGEAPEAGYASGGEAQEAGRTGDGEAPEAGYTSGGEAQEAGRAGGGEAPEAGLAGGGEAPEAGLAGGGEAPEAGDASGWEAQEAGLAGGGEAPEAGRAGGGEAPEAGRASRTQSIGGREGPATPSARRSEEYAPKNRDQNHDWHLDRSREAGAADGRGDAGVPGTAGWPRAELEPGGGAAAGQKFPGPAPAAWRGEARPRFPAPPEFRPPLIRNGGQAGVQRRSFRAVKTADGYELVRLGPAPGLVVISGYPGEITFTRDPFRALAFKAAGCAGQVAVLPRGNAEESLGGRTFRTKRLFFATSLDERDREAVRRLAELPRENEGAADYLVHSTASPEPGRNYG